MDAFSERPKVGNALKLVIGQFDPKMLLDTRQQVQSLQAIDAKRLEKIVVGMQRFAWHLEMLRGEFKDLFVVFSGSVLTDLILP